MKLLGYFHGVDPAACVVVDGQVISFVEEERLLRFKHANNLFPIRSMEACLDLAGLSIDEIDRCVYGWDARAYADGRMASFYERINEIYPPDAGTLGWQRRNLGWFRPEALERRLHDELIQWFGGDRDRLPPLEFVPHHQAHAASAFYLSSFDESLVLVVDGSGDSDCTTVWRGSGTELELLHRVEIPHSLGWFYAAMTELLGFKAYDGEYKVMGLAAYGRENLDFRQRLERFVAPGPLGFDYTVDPGLVHHGAHSYSSRYTDELIEVLGVEPRLGDKPIEAVHEDLAFETQRLLEETVLRLVSHFADTTGIKNLVIGGGVGLNVKMNSRLAGSGVFDRVDPFPIPGDSALGVGASLDLEVRTTGQRPAPLQHLYWGPEFSDEEIEEQLASCGFAYRRCDDIADETAKLLTEGKIVSWFQGPMEAGPRALGGRSILADPRTVESRDRVNASIKFREYWRPFCPSLKIEASAEFLEGGGPAPYMILAFDATERAKREAAGIVHVDGTVRAQTVDAESHPTYHRLIDHFERRTGVPVVLNTSFNVKGEAIVCSPRDALRTFWSTGIDALAIGSFLVEKPLTPVPVEPEESSR